MCGWRKLRRRSRGATSARSSRGWITSSLGAANSKDARTGAISAWPLKAGAALIDEAAARAAGSDAAILTEWSSQLRDSLKDAAAEITALRALALDPARASVVARYADRSLAASADLGSPGRSQARGLQQLVRIISALGRGAKRAARKIQRRRGTAAVPGRHGLRCAVFSAHPSHRPRQPQGHEQRLRAKPGDVGSPWAIGAAEGGHKDILPQLGTFDDFDRL